MKKTIHLLLITCTVLVISCKEKSLPPVGYGPLPSKNQVNWQQLEYYMFIHFGPNTFTNVEWGNGKEDPKVFNPSNLDCRQWAATAKAAGMKAIIITAKHHDGFCLFPSKYSNHTVRESLWKDGKGDVLKELSEACKEYGLKFGVYLSPWDQNHPAYGTDEYNTVFAKTLEEVLTSYGEIFEVWFDGANGEGHGGKKQVYDWKMFHDVVYKNQPNAVIFSDVGPGCRWIGNEDGYVGATNWSRLNITGFEPGAKSPALDTLNVGNIHGEVWLPAEADVSIRPGWFYSPATDDKVKSVEHLLNIYYFSVGRNSNLLLNVPPDRTGRIHRNDSIRLMEFRKVIDESFAENLAKGAAVTANKVRGNSDEYKADNLLDGNYDSYWTTDDNDREASITVELGGTKQFNRLLIQEYIPLGQRIAAFNVEYFDAELNKWEYLIEGTTIGYKRILRFPAVKTNKVKISITKSFACPILNGFGLFNAPETLSSPVIGRNKEGIVSIRCESNDPVIYYTTDGSEPSLSSTLYKKPFDFVNGGEIKAIAVIKNGGQKSEIVKAQYDLAPAKWSVVSPKSDEAEKMIDGNNHSSGRLKNKEALIIDLGEQLSLKGFSYTPINANWAPNIYRYNFYTGTDGNNWVKVKSNALFGNIKNNPIAQDVLFDNPVNARFIKMEPLEMVQTGNDYSIAEIGVLTNK